MPWLHTRLQNGNNQRHPAAWNVDRK